MHSNSPSVVVERVPRAVSGLEQRRGGFRDRQRPHTFSNNRRRSEEISVRLEEPNIRKIRGSSAEDV